MARHNNIAQSNPAWRYGVLLIVALGTLVFMLPRQPSGQVLSCHDFADKRALLIVPLLVILFRPKYSHQAMLLVALGFYVIAKITEINDQGNIEL